MSKIFDKYQALQIEVKSLRETNQKMSKNIDALVSNFKIPELQVSSNIENDELVQVKSEFVNQLNDLKLENKKYEVKIMS
jgi:predicted RNase H-like nuclease (RuvC/YqgF family)